MWCVEDKEKSVVSYLVAKFSSKVWLVPHTDIKDVNQQLLMLHKDKQYLNDYIITINKTGYFEEWTSSKQIKVELDF